MTMQLHCTCLFVFVLWNSSAQCILLSECVKVVMYTCDVQENLIMGVCDMMLASCLEREISSYIRWPWKLKPQHLNQNKNGRGSSIRKLKKYICTHEINTLLYFI